MFLNYHLTFEIAYSSFILGELNFVIISAKITVQNSVKNYFCNFPWFLQISVLPVTAATDSKPGQVEDPLPSDFSHCIQKPILETVNFVMGPFLITSINFRGISVRNRGVPFRNVTSPRSLAPSSGWRHNSLPKSPQLSRAKINWFRGVWAKEILVLPGYRPKKVPKMAQILQNLSREKNDIITWLQANKRQQKRVCRGN